MGGGSKRQTVGYKYFLGMHLALCHGPIDALKAVFGDGKKAWAGSVTNGEFSINAPNLYGGTNREGGIGGVRYVESLGTILFSEDQGLVDFENGTSTQTENEYLQSKLGDNIPAFRGVSCVVFKQTYLGNSPYLKPMSFLCQRVYSSTDGQEQWYAGKAGIYTGDIANAAIYFALDYSGSMTSEVAPGVTRFDIQTEAMLSVLDAIGDAIGSIQGNRIDIAISGFGNSTEPKNEYIELFNCDASDITTLKNFINAGVANKGTYFEAGVEDAPSFFSSVPSSQKRISVFMTDGGASDNPSIGGAILDSISDLKAVAFNIGLSDTSDTEYMDNTDVPVLVVDESNVEEIEAVILNAIRGGFVDMNPAHIIRECLTDTNWGMGYQSADIDSVSFTAAADTLFEEGFGLSLLWDKQIPIENFISEIVKHIDGVLSVDRSAGKFTLKLIRDDYEDDSLLELNESNIEKLTDISRPSFGELPTSVTVTYVDAETGEEASLTVQDSALVQMQNAIINTTVQYPGITNAELATRVGLRDLKALSTPLWTVTIYANSTAKTLNIGDVFKFSWSDYGLNSKIMRVMGIAYGDGKSNKIKIQAAEDVFSISATSLYSSQTDGWEEPDTTSAPCTVKVVDESPYYASVVQFGQSVVDDTIAADSDIGYIFAAAGIPSNDSTAINAELHVDSGGGYVESDTLDFSPYATLSADLTRTQTTAAIENAVDLDLLEFPCFAQINDELVRIDSISSSSVTIGRAILDTVPATHEAGDKLIIWSDFASSDFVEYEAAEEIYIKILPSTLSGTLDISDATADTVTLDSRAVRPYPPAKVTINDEFFPQVVDGSEDTVIVWVGRNRLQQTGGEFLDFEDNGITAETGTTYNLRFYDVEDSNNLLREVENLDALTYTYEAEVEAGDVVGGVGYGNSYGKYYGNLVASVDFDAYMTTVAPRIRYKLDETTGTTATDDGSLGNDATFEVDYTLAQPSLRGDGVGKSVKLNSFEWTPAGIVTSAWYDFNDESTITLNGSKIEQIDDKSGNNTNLTQATSADQPTQISIGDLKAASFDGVSQFLVASTPLIDVTHSMFIVFKPVIESTKGALFGQWAAGQVGRHEIMCNQDDSGFDTSGRMNLYNSTCTNGSGDFNFLEATDIAGVTTLAGCVSTTGSENFKFYQNGGLVDSGTITAVLQTNSAVGRNSALSGTDYYDGIVCEIVILDFAASDRERQKLEGYLAHKWGFESSLDVSHPYRYNPPIETGQINLGHVTDLNDIGTTGYTESFAIDPTNGYLAGTSEVVWVDQHDGTNGRKISYETGNVKVQHGIETASFADTYAASTTAFISLIYTASTKTVVLYADGLEVDSHTFTNALVMPPDNYTDYADSLSGQVLILKMNETTGTTIEDTSGNNYDGTISGSYSLDQTPPTRINDGGAIGFTNASILANHTLYSGTTFSINFWGKMDADNAYEYFASLNYQAPWVGVRSNESATSNKLHFRIKDDAASGSTEIVVDVDLDAWNMYTIIVTLGGDFKVYVNTSLEGSTTVANNPAKVGILGEYNNRLGSDRGGSFNLNGGMDDFRVFDRILTTTEIEKLYNDGVAGANTDYTIQGDHTLDEYVLIKEARTDFNSVFSGAVSSAAIPKLKIELESERDGYTSYQKHEITIHRPGYGYNYGYGYGGI